MEMERPNVFRGAKIILGLVNKLRQNGFYKENQLLVGKTEKNNGGGFKILTFVPNGDQLKYSFSKTELITLNDDIIINNCENDSDMVLINKIISKIK